MLNKLKKMLEEKRYCKVKVIINNFRNKSEEVVGTIEEVYDRLFILSTNEGTKRSISYSDIMTNNIKIIF